jgi:hypothetical protein
MVVPQHMSDLPAVKKWRKITYADIGHFDNFLLVRGILEGLQNSMISAIVGPNANELRCHAYINFIL